MPCGPVFLRLSHPGSSQQQRDLGRRGLCANHGLEQWLADQGRALLLGPGLFERTARPYLGLCGRLHWPTKPWWAANMRKTGCKWLAGPHRPVPELGAESGNGERFPGNTRAQLGRSYGLVCPHGGDMGNSHNWRAGISWLNTHAQERTWADANDPALTNASLWAKLGC